MDSLSMITGTPVAQERVGPTSSSEDTAEQAEEFAGALAVANSTPNQAQAAPLKNSVSQTEVEKKLVNAVQSENDKAAAKYAAAGKANAAEGETKAEKMGQLQNQRNTTSAMAGAVSAGPNPWSGDWVFEPSEANMLKEGASQDAAIKEALEKLRNAQNAPKPNVISPSGSTQSTPEHGGVAVLAGMQDVQVESDGLDADSVQKPKGRGLDSKGAAGSLSGAEFLTTLQQAKNGQGSQTGAGSDGNSQKRPQLRSIEGDGAKAGPRFGDDSLPIRPGATKPNLMAHETISPVGVMPGPVHEAGIQGRQVAGNAALQGGVPLLTGHVTSGSMARDRLSSESVNGIGMQIRNFQNVGNGGEIRVRLKPDHLGELNLRVSTQGNSVGLQIRATDERAKQILEDSMSALRDSLAAQSLSLGKVEVTLAGGSQLGQGFGQSDSWQNQNPAAQQDLNLNNGFNNPGSQRGFDQAWNDQGRSQGHQSSAREADYAGIIRSPIGATGARRPQAAAAGRLDVMA
ncbi:MAG: flagellar hook-length control protein FliK [Bdellovibrionales bacterium]|nr:flagellar hook-length control protein FliK [Bdellovibrionales bacterium]